MNILKNPTHVAKISYNGFDMQQNYDFTCAPCQLLPVYYDILNPGDKVTCKGVTKLRTQPLEAAAEFSATVRLDWFAVPLEQLFKFFGQMYYGIQDVGTNFLNIGRTGSFTPSANYPYFSVAGFYNYIIQEYASVRAADTSTTATLFEYVPYELIPWSGFSSSVGRATIYLADTFRLMDHLGYPVATMTSNTGVDLTSSFPVTALAYQKIYYDYYRNTEFQNNDPHAYNVDKHIESSSQTIPYATLLSDIFRLHYVPWKKDFFHNVFSSPLQGSQSVGSLGTDLGLVNQWLSGLSNVLTSSPSSQTTFPYGGNVSLDNIKPTTVRLSTTAGSSGSSLNNLATAVSSINPANINAMFAVQKALEITRRSGKHYDMQTLAHWGVEVPPQLDGEVLYLGSQNQPFVVGDVVSTAASGNEPLGTIAGKAYSSPSLNGSYLEEIRFEAKTHSVLMCVFSVQPDLTYTQEGIEKLNNLVSPADWLHPEYDNLGMQPIFTNQFLNNYSNPTGVKFWQYSYSELKQKHNRVTGNVSSYGTLDAWVPQISYNSPGNNPVSWFGSDAYFFYGSPSWLNGSLSYKFMYNLFVSSGSPGLIANWYQYIYERDPFIVHCEFDCRKASKMSTYGLQNL